MSNTMKRFSEVLASYKASIKDTMEYAQEAANLALTVFEESGNTNPLKQFYDATPKNFGRREAIKIWAMNFSPLMIIEEKGGDKWIKGKDADGNLIRPFDVEKAKLTAYWEFTPDATGVTYYPTQIVEALENALKKFNGKKYSAGNEKAIKALALAVNAVHHLKDDVVLMLADTPVPSSEETEKTEEPVVPSSETKVSETTLSLETKAA